MNGGAMSGTGGAATSGKAFSQCRFHFGTIDSLARNNPSMLAELDFFTPGWMGQKDTFDMQYVCDEAKAQFQNQVPVIVAYVAAFHAKRHLNLVDCNVAGGQNLCQLGAQYLQEHLTDILATYDSYGRGFASCFGTTRPIIFEMEPDIYQYTYPEQGRPISAQLAGQIMSQFVNALKKHLPNALFSMDISPWVSPNNGSDSGKSWYANFDMSLFTFINTSGGGTEAGNTKIRSSNNMTWAGVSQVTGKPILADTGYGVNGSSSGHDSAWDNANNINARINDGVIGISQYNPNSNWGTTIANLRSQLKMPRSCP